MPVKKSLTIEIENNGKVNLTDRDFLAAGGQGSVYKYKDFAVKIYHDPKQMIPVKKVRELSTLNCDNILAPSLLVFDSSHHPIGFAMPFAKGTEVICKLFTTGFRNQIGFNEQATTDLVKKIQQIVAQVHSNKCLIVDLNEFSLLVDSKKYEKPYFCDVDSWQTPSYPALALMESVRDRLIKQNKWTELSDWFSFAIVAFQLYIGIHPYKGMHPDYSPKDWIQRMQDGVSVFDKKTIIPPSCRPFSVIPKAHFNWFQEIFKNALKDLFATWNACAKTSV